MANAKNKAKPGYWEHKIEKHGSIENRLRTKTETLPIKIGHRFVYLRRTAEDKRNEPNYYTTSLSIGPGGPWMCPLTFRDKIVEEHGRGLMRKIRKILFAMEEFSTIAASIPGKELSQKELS